LDLGSYDVVRWKLLASEMIFSVCHTLESPRGLSQGCMVGGVGSRNGFWEQDVSFYHQGLEILIMYYDKYLIKFGNSAGK
jgi:hypothetical protein